MKTLEIGGNDRAQNWDRERKACRGVVLRDGKLLLSYGTATDLWMIPGGGLEAGESETECCAREVEEETGYLVRPEDCVLEITDYFKTWKMINRYFLATVIGRAEAKLTDREEQVGMEPRWIPVEEALEHFSHYDDYAETNELRCCLYVREYTALKEIFGL